jgi:hypothetical protein
MLTTFPASASEMNLHIHMGKSDTLNHGGETSGVKLQLNVSTKQSQKPIILLFFTFTKCYLCQGHMMGKAWGKNDTIQLILNLRISTVCITMKYNIVHRVRNGIQNPAKYKS